MLTQIKHRYLYFYFYNLLCFLVKAASPCSSLLQSYMNLPPDKLKLLSQYDNDKKWELVCDQVRASSLGDVLVSGSSTWLSAGYCFLHVDRVEAKCISTQKKTCVIFAVWKPRSALFCGGKMCRHGNGGWFICCVYQPRQELCHVFVVEKCVTCFFSYKERFQVKSPPSTYLVKIKSFYQDQGGVSRRVSTKRYFSFNAHHMKIIWLFYLFLVL